MKQILYALLVIGIGNSVPIISMEKEEEANLSSKQMQLKRKFLEAVKDGNFSRVVELVEQGADVNARTYGGSTALMEFVGKGYQNMVKYLVEHGADVNAKDNRGRTALMEAARKDYRNMVKYLVQSGADVNVRDYDGLTALVEAAKYGHLNTVKYLIAQNADVGSKNDALIHVACHKHLDVLKYLVQHGADVDVQNNNGWTPLMFAANNGFLAALNCGAYHASMAIIKYLVAHGANVNIKNYQGRTAYDILGEQDYPDIAAYLKRYSELQEQLEIVKEKLSKSQSSKDFNVTLGKVLRDAIDSANPVVIRYLLKNYEISRQILNQLLTRAKALNIILTDSPNPVVIKFLEKKYKLQPNFLAELIEKAKALKEQKEDGLVLDDLKSIGQEIYKLVLMNKILEPLALPNDVVSKISMQAYRDLVIPDDTGDFFTRVYNYMQNFLKNIT